jgi:hypothetical protein
LTNLTRFRVSYIEYRILVKDGLEFAIHTEG